jgi:hypothetical protein
MYNASKKKKKKQYLLTTNKIHLSSKCSYLILYITHCNLPEDCLVRTKTCWRMSDKNIRYVHLPKTFVLLMVNK